MNTTTARPFTDAAELLICRLADVAGVLRDARRAGTPTPLVCVSCGGVTLFNLFDSKLCAHCHFLGAVRADRYHRDLTHALRMTVLAECRSEYERIAA